ncbi:winged helix-turn-helix domain-containing protein [Salinivibrio kushneri]|uniref:Winged helix-turn-helix domain-containing protein n=1 Tax=Salinivibrio kushneri TaxID=1908198 RepID=A0AA47KME1_9GAMM|nr:winged helix-turn-helix domain-containing protein [Salinivibrio kushneri]WBA09650.1 winged helix-turn-helix domain-containing protein [Salinivibrio kushneri]
MIYFDNVARKLHHNNKSTRIGFRETLVLECLLKHAPQAVSKKTLICYGWGSEYIGQTSLAKSISALRRALLAVGADASLVITVPKYGYRLTEGMIFQPPADLVCSEERDDEPVQHSESPQEAQPAQTDAVSQRQLKVPFYRQCLLIAMTLLLCVATSVFVVGKINGWRWSDLVQRGGLSQKRVGALNVFYRPDAELSFSIEQLLTHSQCNCLVYIEKEHKYSTLIFVSKKTHRSTFIRYSPLNIVHATQQINEFLKEEK